MKSYVITYNDKLEIDELSTFGEITYDSKVMRMIWLKTNVDVKKLDNIKGVVKVEIEIKQYRRSLW